MNDSSHYAVLKELNEHVTVKVADSILAESDRVIGLSEFYQAKEYPSVMYFPRVDVNMDLLSKVDGFQTTCPIKGAASYFNLNLGEENAEDIAKAAWSYETPLPESEKIKEYIAFDLGKLKPSISSTEY